MTYNRLENILPLVNYNVFWPNIGNLYCIASFLLATISYFLLVLFPCFSNVRNLENKREHLKWFS